MRTTLRIAVLLLVVFGCAKRETLLPTDTKGNATDRTVDGTTGTGEAKSPATDTAAAAQQLGTVAPSRASTSGGPLITATSEVHGAATVTTSTIESANTATAAVVKPTETTATVAQKH
jgi:hypothetical protein